MDEPLEGSATAIVVIAACIAFGALLAAVDAALSALGDGRLRAERDGGPLAEVAARYLKHDHAIHSRLLAGRALLLTCAVALATLQAQPRGEWMGLLAAGAVALVYGVVAGASSVYTRRHASGVALTLLQRIRPLELVLTPLALPLAWTGSLVERLFPPSPEHDPERVTEADVEHMVEQGEQFGSITQDHASLLRGVLDFHDTSAREIMVPRTQMVAIEIATPVDEVLALITETGHSRYPVYRDRVDQVVGVLYAKDLFRAMRDGTGRPVLRSLVRKDTFFVAPNQQIGLLLREMQQRRVHLAVVSDEYGGTAGIITLEDILEEIVGDIQDEHDREVPPVRELDDGRYLVDASISLADLEDVVGVVLRDEQADCDSLGGLLVETAGRVPSAGEQMERFGLRFTVTESDARHVLRVEIERRHPAPDAAE